MSQRREIIGKTFGRLTVESYVGSNAHGQAVWRCTCACGGEKNVLGYLLTRGDVKSCGCMRGRKNRNKSTVPVRNVPMETIAHDPK